MQAAAIWPSLLTCHVSERKQESMVFQFQVILMRHAGFVTASSTMMMSMGMGTVVGAGLDMLGCGWGLVGG